MPDRNLKTMKIGLGRITEANFNSIIAANTGAGGVPPNTNNYIGVKTRGEGFPLPDWEKFDDENTSGGGTGFRQQGQRTGYVNAPTMEITHDVNTDLLGYIARRHAGGPDTVTELEATLAQEHLFGQQDENGAFGTQLPSFNVVYALGAADFVYAGCVVDTFRVDQAGAGTPTFTAGIVGSGLFYKIAAMAAPVKPVVPKPTIMHNADGPESKISFQPPTGPLVVLTTPEQRARGFTFTSNNNIDTGDTRMGDARVDPATTKKGWVRGRLPFGDRVITCEQTILPDNDLTEWALAQNDALVTSYKYTSRGSYITVGATTSTLHQYTFEIIIPACNFRNVRMVSDGGKAALQVSVVPIEAPTQYGYYQFRLVNEVTTVIV